MAGGSEAKGSQIVKAKTTSAGRSEGSCLYTAYLDVWKSGICNPWRSLQDEEIAYKEVSRFIVDVDRNKV